MIKNSSKQVGSAHVFIIIILVIALIGALGFIFWNNFLKNDENTKNTGIRETTMDTPKETTDEKTYKNDIIGISFNYPIEWVNIICDNNQKVVYFGSDSRGIGLSGDSSILCGPGTDFPPQMAFSIRENFSFEGNTEPIDIVIDGRNAKKYTYTTGRDSILPGLEITTYIVTVNSKDSVVIVYNKWGEDQSDSYDTSSETKEEFTNLVERSLRFL